MQDVHPLNQKDIQILSMGLGSVGAWPSECFEKNSRRRYLTMFIIIVTIINTSGEIIYLRTHFHNLSFFDLVDKFMTIVLTLQTFVRAVYPTLKCYGDVTKEFLMEFHLNHFKHKGEYNEKITNQINKFTHYFTYFSAISSIFGPVCFNIPPLINNYRNGAFGDNMKENKTVQFSVYYLHSWFDPAEHVIIASFFNLYLSYFCAILVVGADLLMSLMAFHIIGHIKILIHDLQHIPKPKYPIVMDVSLPKSTMKISLYNEVYDAQENIYIREKMIKFVEHHKIIVSFAESVSDLFGPMIATTYSYHLISCAMLLLQCSQGELAALARYGPLTVIIFYELIQISTTFELIGSESTKLIDEVYYIPWESMNVSNQRLVWIFFSRIQIPIRVTALGMVDVGVQAMLAILKTTFSYFALLRSME